MSLVTTDDVEAVMAPGIDADALQDVIDREESWLARRIGQLEGERTQTLRPPVSYDGPLQLQRMPLTDDITVSMDGTELDADAFRLLPWGRIELVSERWISPIEVTYTPDDEAEVKRVVLELVRIALSSSPYASESSEGHSYQRNPNIEPLREALARRLIRPFRGTASISFTGR